MKLAHTLAFATVVTAAVLGATAHADDGYVEDGYCREFQRTVTIGGQAQNSYGTACLQPDGAWKVINEGAQQATLATAPAPIIVQQPVVVYQEPVYRRYDTAFWGAPAWWGINLSFNDHNGWRGGDYRHGYYGGYHGGYPLH